MEIIDIVLGLPLLYGFYKGFRKGLIMEFVSILALILALIGGFKLMDQCLIILVDVFGKPHPFFPFLAFILVFAGIVFGVNILGKALKGLVGMTILGSFDKIIGALIGVLKWTFALSLILWLIESFAPHLFSQEMRDNAVLLPFLLAFAPHIFHILMSLLPFLGEMMESIKELLNSESAFNN
jgi:membrane protein required for colicin V production